MKIKATNDQIAQMLKNVFDASVPVGMGFLHYKREGLPLEHFQAEVKNAHPTHGIDLDYVQGRMVKFSIQQDPEGKENVWKLFTNFEPQSDYQSWATKYHTYRDLVNSVEGIEILNLE